MSKDKQEKICFSNLYSNIGGKYVSDKLNIIKQAKIIDSWDESPDFLLVDGNNAFGIEHFVFDQTYIERRAGSRVVNEETWAIYDIYHKDLEDGAFNSNNAAKDLEKLIQDMVDIATMFDYETCMNQFDRIFNKHAKKIINYMNNLNNYREKNIYFLIEVRSLFINNYKNNTSIKCIAHRKDDAIVDIDVKQVVFTNKMIDIIKNQIGVLKGIVFQNYSFFDLNNKIKSMVFIDTSSIEAFKNSLEKQRIKVYKDYYYNVPRVRTCLNVVSSSNN